MAAPRPIDALDQFCLQARHEAGVFRREQQAGLGQGVIVDERFGPIGGRQLTAQRRPGVEERNQGRDGLDHR